ncbi:MATE family efflux transporter [Pseudomonas sp. J237]|uniref:MATE family efflux transporter n=1 Tax=Pseudomonas TaxID=286 RepID=UPI000854AD34|nr:MULTISPECIES: MATE family efflux transporter [Pseudomonas]MAB98502.1 MATE family efflux transporter [Pseudomonadaceae bacterium]OEO25995.1 MATE family efflux transporter [Pseudomonas sp. J237]
MAKSRQDLFINGSIPRALLTLAFPIILANILQAGYQLTDAYWVGRVGADAIAAVAVSAPVTFLVIAMGSGLAMAGATLTAQYMGAGKQDMVNHVAAQSMLMVTITSVVLGALGYFLSPHLLGLLGVTPEVQEGALGYMRVSFIGVIFVFIYVMFQSLMRGVGQTRVPLFIVLATVILNFGLDPLFIFGYGPFKGHGVMGAAMATLVTQGIAACIGMIIFLRGRHGIKLKWSGFKPDFNYIKKAFFLGFPGSVELSTRGLGLIVMSFLVASFNTTTIASYGIGSNVLQVVMIPAMGLSMAVSTLVGQNIGAGNIQRASTITLLGTAYGFTALTLVGCIAYWLAPLIVAVFAPTDQAVIREGSQFIRTMCLAWGGIGVQLCVVSAFRASGNMLSAMIIAMVSQWMIQFPLAYVLAKHTTLGSAGIWWSFPVTNILVAIIALCWFARGSWKKTRITEEDIQTIKVTDGALTEEGYR